MTNDRLNDVVERLQSDRRFLKRFRRSPRWALRGRGLSRREAKALKRGRADELLELGLDPAYVRPIVAEVAPLQGLILRRAKRLTPVALLAAASLAIASAAGAPAGSRRRVGAAGAKRRTIPTNLKGLRYVEARRTYSRRFTGFVGRVAVNVGKAKPPVKGKARRKRARKNGRAGRKVEIVHRVAGGPNFDYGQATTNRKGIFRISGPQPPPGTQTFKVTVKQKKWQPKQGRAVVFRAASRRLTGDF